MESVFKRVQTSCADRPRWDLERYVSAVPFFSVMKIEGVVRSVEFEIRTNKVAR